MPGTSNPAAHRWTSRRDRLAREFVQLRPAPDAERVALRASVTMAVTMVVLWRLGLVSQTLPASFGVLASVYGGRAPTLGRWRIQARHALVLLAAVTSGTIVALAEQRSWLSVPVAALWAAGAALASDRQRWVPPGPLFCVFAMTSCASIPATWHRVGVTALVFVGTAALAVGLGALEAWLAQPLAPRRPGAHPASADPRRQRVQAVRCGVAVGVSGALATAVGIGHPYWAMVAACAPVAASGVTTQLVRGIHRTLGTLVGLPVAALIIWLPLPTLAVLLVSAALQGVVELLVGRHYGLAMVFITPLALVLGHAASPTPTGVLLRDRAVETLIGSVVGMVVVLLTRPRPGTRIA